MGSTTGSLWTSEDGGRNWQSFDGQLPPIYGRQLCVTIATYGQTLT
jgi:hypothetical protein